MTITNWTPVVLIGLAIAFAVYRRGRTLFTRQKLRPTMLTARLGLFAVLGVIVFLLNVGEPHAVGAGVAGFVVGAGVAVVGTRLTQWEYLPDGAYYTAIVYVGVAVIGMFLLRL